VYKVTSAGITLSNIYQTTVYNSFIKASPYSIAAQKCNVYCADGVLDFDLTTGVLSNLQSVGDAIFAAEFSHNGNYLYTSQSPADTGVAGIYRYDILTSNTIGQSLASTRVFISPAFGGFYRMQLAPDGKIYYVRAEKIYRLKQLLQQ
jgi:hypothetical protein